MSDKKLSLDLEINKGGSEKTVKSIKQELREAKEEAIALQRKFGEFSPEAQNAARKLAGLRDEMEDLNQSVQGLNPDKFARMATLTNGLVRGFQVAQGAMAMFGVAGEDMEKTIAKLQATMAMADGIQGVLDARKQFAALAMTIKTQVVTAFSTLKGAIAATGIGALVVAIGVLIEQAGEYNERLEKEYDLKTKINEADKIYIDDIEKKVELQNKEANEAENGLNQKQRELKLLEAEGASAEKIFKKKKEIAELEVLNLRRARGSGLDVEKEYADKRAEIAAMELSFNKSVADKKKEITKKETEDRKKTAEEKRQDDLKEQLEMIATLNKRAEIKRDEGIALRDADIKQRQEKADQQVKDDKIAEERNAKIAATEKAFKDKQLQDEKLYRQALQDLAINSATSLLQSLDTINQSFAGNTEAAQKKAFERSKVFQIAETLISTYAAAQKAYASQFVIPTPDSPIRGAVAAGVAVVSGLARVAAISKTQYGSKTGTNPSNGGGISSPNIATGFSYIGRPQTQEPPKQLPPQKVYIVSHEIKSALSTDDAILSKAVVK